jgi:hypothetical protein
MNNKKEILIIAIIIFIISLIGLEINLRFNGFESMVLSALAVIITGISLIVFKIIEQ